MNTGQLVVGAIALAGAVVTLAALYGAVQEAVNRVGCALARRTARRLAARRRHPAGAPVREPVPLAGLDPIVVAEQFHHEAAVLTEEQQTEAARLIREWSA